MNSSPFSSKTTPQAEREVETRNVFDGSRLGKKSNDKFSAGRERLAQVLALYREGFGHKAIAKQLQISPRIARVMLIEEGVYQPGSLHSGEKHRQACAEATRARVPAWRLEEKRRLAEHVKKRTAAFADLPLFKKRINKLVKRENKSKRTEQMLGISYLDFIAYIESLWMPGMTWDNHGRGTNGVWHIDHKRPCASFDLTDERQIAECFHYTNMQPLWGAANVAKGDKWPVL